MNIKRMKPRAYRRSIPEVLCLAALAVWTTSSLQAQATVPVADETATDTEEMIVLSPFEVVGEKDSGYAATSSLAGSRLNTDLRDIAAAVQVITPEFMKDLGATNLPKLLVYTTNTEVGGVGGNFYGGDTNSKGYAQRMLSEPQKTARIRGLNDADITREYFPTDIPMDWYSLSRVDISRGPNSILFGLGSPAGLINNTLKVPGMRKGRTGFVELSVGSYGSHRQVIDVDQTLIPNQLGLRVSGVNDEAQFRQDFTYNHDKRVYAAVRWQPKLGKSIFTQIDVQSEWGKIRGNRPMGGTPGDFISNWFGPANKLAIPTDEYWTAPGMVEGLYAEQTIGGQLWDNHAVSFFSDAHSGAVGLPGNPVQAMLLRGNSNVNGGGWGSWVGLLNPNWNVQHANNPKRTKAYYANNPTITAAINDFEARTGRTFSGFGQGMWPMQMIVDGPLSDLLRNQNIVGPNKREYNEFDDINLAFTQTYLNGRLGINAAYNRQNYETGYTNLMEGLWGMNMISVDVNQTLRGSMTPNPNFGRPYTIGEGRGGIYERKRENWRITAFGMLKASDFFKSDSWLTKILGDHTFTGVRSSQHFENLDRNYALYRWDSPYLLAVDGPNPPDANGNDRPNGYATWRGLHYLGPSLLNTPSMNAITTVQGVRTYQAPTLTQFVRHYSQSQGGWRESSFNLLSAENNIDKLYDGANQGYDNTDSKVFVWQGKMLNNVLVPIFGWREDSYTRWNKPGPRQPNPPDDPFGGRNPTYGYVEPFSPAWDYDPVKAPPLIASSVQRRSWSLALHGRELMELIGYPMPRGLDVTLLYNDSSSFRPSDVAVDVYNQPEDLPSGKTRDLSVLVSAFDNKVSLRVTKYKTVQKNTPYSGPGPDWGWTKANLARSMDGMMWEVGAWADSDPTRRVQPTPEWLVNRWMFGDGGYDATIANTPLPANWQNDLATLMNQPLRIRQSAVVGSPTYVAEGTLDPNNSNRPYVAPPLTEDEVAYRAEWFRARTDAQWSRPLDQKFWNAMGFSRDYTATWGGYWEPNAWTRPQNQRSLNDLTSEGTEYELTANPLPNWRLTINASRADAVRSSVLDSWDAYIQANKDFHFDGGYTSGDTPATNYWNFRGYYDIPHTPGNPVSTTDRLGAKFNDSIYNLYYQAKATEDQRVNELRKWHWNAITNYTFVRGFLKNVGLGGAVRWQDRSTIGYYPKFNSTANAWVIDLNNPIKGPSEVNYDAWLSYERALGRKITWSIQLNVNDLFSKSRLIPTAANPDGTIAQARIPSQTTWTLRNTFKF